MSVEFNSSYEIAKRRTLAIGFAASVIFCIFGGVAIRFWTNNKIDVTSAQIITLSLATFIYCAYNTDIIALLAVNRFAPVSKICLLNSAIAGIITFAIASKATLSETSTITQYTGILIGELLQFALIRRLADSTFRERSPIV
jgi:hypothetical protein